MRVTRVLLLTWLAATAAAQDIQNFQPATGTWSYFHVEGARTAEHLQLVPTLYVNYGHEPLVTRDLDGRIVDRLVSHLVTTDVLIAFGLWDRFELGLAAPIHHLNGSAVDPEGFAFGDLRFIPKVRLFGFDDTSERVAVSILVPVSVPTGDPDRFVGGDQVTVQPKLVFEADLGLVSIGINAGVRVRPEERTVDDLQLDDELTYGAGVGVWLWKEDLRGLAEVYGASPLADVQDESHSNPLELLAGLRYFVGGAVINAGLGTGLVPDYGSPVVRALLGVGWHDRERDTDGDGILDDDDKCPDDPEDKDGFEDADGCPDPDNDKDGIPDTSDACPDDAEDADGYADEDGCPDPDNDQDGLLDAEDRCPDEPETKNGFEDADGCPDVAPPGDRDKDGIVDDDDKCPDDPEDKDGFEDADGCPDPDNDQDGIPDASDSCPNEPETKNGVDDEDGCPDQKLVRLTKGKIEILERVYFETNKDVIKRESFPVLDEVAQVLVATPALRKVRVEGHTDDVGKDAYNLELSQRRAHAVRRYLMDKGVEPQRLLAQGYGEAVPIADNKTEDGRAENRRVEFVILERE